MRVISKYCLRQVHDDTHFKGKMAYSDAYFVSCLVAYLRHFTSETGLFYDLVNLLKFK